MTGCSSQLWHVIFATDEAFDAWAMQDLLDRANGKTPFDEDQDDE